ncbi:MAG: hypothetical protein WCO98_14660 [bacterium]
MKQLCSHHRANFVKFFFYLIAIAVIPLILASCFNKQEPAPAETSSNVDRTVAGGAPGQITSEPAQSIPGRAVQKAISEKCKENLRQIRMSIFADKDSNGGTYPATLGDAVKGGGYETSCPIGHEQYTYDPETGKVKCPHPGHEDY